MLRTSTPSSSSGVAEVGYALGDLGRYVHTKEYLQGLAIAVGFETVELRETVCREHHGVPVPAFLAAFRRP